MFAVRNLLLFLFFGMAILAHAVAQKGLEGLWEGTLTYNHGEEGVKSVKFELYLVQVKKSWQGKSILYLEDGNVVEMNIRGTMYEDRSMYFTDVEFVSQPESKFEPPFFRKYQFVYERSIWDPKIEGFWQENIYGPFEQKRRHGRIFLKKVKESSKA